MSPGRHAVSRRHRPEGWLVVLVVGCAAAAVAVARPGWAWAPGAVQAAGVGAAVVGVVRYRPVNGHAWWLLLAGGAGWTTADAVLHAGVRAQVAAPRWSSVLLVVAYGVFAVAMALLTRRPGSRIATTLDSLIIGGAALVTLWTFAIRPMLGSAATLHLGTVLGVGHATAAAVLVTAVLRFAALDQRPGGASALLSFSALALALADVAVAAPVTGAAGLDRVGALAGQVWAVALGAAALHPEATRLQTMPQAQGPAISSRRFVAFVLLAVVVPVAPLGVAASGRGAGPADLDAYLPPTLAAVAVSVLVVIRLGLIARVAEGQTRDLRRSLRQRAALERELRHRVTHDPLTGLVNRAVLMDRLDRILTTPQSKGGTLVIIDLDGFKDVNDTLGHAVGDEVLVQVAERLRGAVDAADLVVRMGGDEFAMLCAPGIDGRIQARQALDALRPGLRAGAGEVYLSGTAGLVDLGESGTSADALRDADLALSAAKEIGKNQLVTFHADLREARVRKGELAAGLRRALAAGRLAVHYQPVVDLADGRMAAVEALVRWTDEDGTMIPPMDFIPVAEETGMIVPVGRFVLRRACADAAAWHREYGIAVTVNVSGHQLREPDFVAEVLGVLEASGLPPRALVLELTETTMITRIEETQALAQLRTLGVRVAVDDFGTGYSSLSYLVRLPVDILKIDRAFTSPPAQPAPHHWTFVRAILDLAASLNLTTIAEGVETDQQAHTLRNLDCPLAQGYLYSRAVPARAIAELLSAWNTRFAADEPRPVDLAGADAATTMVMAPAHPGPETAPAPAAAATAPAPAVTAAASVPAATGADGAGDGPGGPIGAPSPGGVPSSEPSVSETVG